MIYIEKGTDPIIKLQKEIEWLEKRLNDSNREIKYIRQEISDGKKKLKYRQKRLEKLRGEKE